MFGSRLVCVTFFRIFLHAIMVEPYCACISSMVPVFSSFCTDIHKIFVMFEQTATLSTYTPYLLGPQNLVVDQDG